MAVEALDVEEKRMEPSERQIQNQRDLSLILHLRGRERMEAILASDDPEEIFQSLPEEEAYVTIKEIGEQDALPLLSLMSASQCQYLLDLELWKGYEMDIRKIERWMPLLLSCDGEAVSRWLRSLDTDTLLLILKKTIRVHLKEDEKTILPKEGEKALFTLNGTYYVEVLYPSLETQIEQLLRHLADTDLDFYWRLLSQVQWEVGAELEERTLRFREARLEDKGFPPMEEALSLYQHLSPKRLKKMLEQKEIYLAARSEDEVVPSFPMVLKDQTVFFSLCLRELTEGPLADRLKMELTYMANQVMVADQPETIDLSTIQGSLRKVGGYLSIGLELLSGGNLQTAKEWIEQTPLKFIFQVGFGATLEVKWRAKKVWQNAPFSKRGIPLSFLGSPWEERMKGLLAKRPIFYEEAPERGYREFRSLEEIQSLHRDLDRIELLGRVFSCLPSFSYSEGLLWKTVLLTAHLHDQQDSLARERLSTAEEALSWLKEHSKEKGDAEGLLMRWLLQKTGLTGEAEVNLLRDIAATVVGEIELS